MGHFRQQKLSSATREGLGNASWRLHAGESSKWRGSCGGRRLAVAVWQVSNPTTIKEEALVILINSSRSWRWHRVGTSCGHGGRWGRFRHSGAGDPGRWLERGPSSRTGRPPVAERGTEQVQKRWGGGGGEATSSCSLDCKWSPNKHRANRHLQQLIRFPVRPSAALVLQDEKRKAATEKARAFTAFL